VYFSASTSRDLDQSLTANGSFHHLRCGSLDHNRPCGLLHIPIQMRLCHDLADEGPARFPSLDGTPFRDSRCSFGFRRFDQRDPVRASAEFTPLTCEVHIIQLPRKGPKTFVPKLVIAMRAIPFFALVDVDDERDNRRDAKQLISRSRAGQSFGL
jgi:hypothetical protein